MISISIFVIPLTFTTGAFAQNYVSTYPPLNDLGDGNVLYMVTNSPFLSGQLVKITGNLVTVNSIQIVLDDPHGRAVASKTTFSDRDGYFTSELQIPTDAEAGIWQIVGTSGIYHRALNFTITGNSDTVTCYAGDLCSKPIANTTVQHGPNSTVSMGMESPLKQFRSGVVANDIKCGQGLQLVIRAEDNSPACVKPQTAQKLVERKWGWIMQPIDSIKLLLPYRIIGLENNSGIVTLGNKTYYFVTPNYTNSAYSNQVQISFHDVLFTLFPPGFRGGLPSGGCGSDTVGQIVTGGGQYYWTDVKFSDGVQELLHIFADSQPCPIYPTQTYFSNHTNPQAGLTFYDGKMKLLVSTSIIDSTVNGPKFKVGPDLLGPIPHQLVFFMKSNSTAKIFVEYASHEPNTGTMPSYSSVYVGKGGDYSPLTTSAVTINADPSSIPLTQGSDTIVVYNITAKEGVKGVYWIFLAQFCGVMPLAIDINSLTISPFDLPVQTGTMYCPAQFLDRQILGISEGTAEYKIGQPVK